MTDELFAAPAGGAPGGDDPVSWLQIEPGWSVVGSDGGVVGNVLTVTGDKQGDIFDGLAVGAGPSGPIRYVPGEQVGPIYPRRVTLQIASAAFGALELYEEPPPETELQLPKQSLTTRLSGWLRGGR
jgi:hypothetical protein